MVYHNIAMLCEVCNHARTHSPYRCTICGVVMSPNCKPFLDPGTKLIGKCRYSTESDDVRRSTGRQAEFCFKCVTEKMFEHSPLGILDQQVKINIVGMISDTNAWGTFNGPIWEFTQMYGESAPIKKKRPKRKHMKIQ